LLDIVRREGKLLLKTDMRLFTSTINANWVRQLEYDDDLAERLDAFVSRFGCMQDTIGDKLLPALLIVLGEKPGAVIDNLDRAERLGFLRSADEWITMRQLRNQMIHEYIEDMEVLTHALNTGHAFVPTLVNIANKMIAEAERRING
jgi:uncharacterized protein with HEPN domain